MICCRLLRANIVFLLLLACACEFGYLLFGPNPKEDKRSGLLDYGRECWLYRLRTRRLEAYCIWLEVWKMVVSSLTRSDPGCEARCAGSICI